MDEWTDLREFPIIFLCQDASVYTNPADRRFRFNSSTECLEIAHGVTDRATGTFTDLRGNTSNFTVDDIIEFKLIHGFVRSSQDIGYGYYGRIGF